MERGMDFEWQNEPGIGAWTWNGQMALERGKGPAVGAQSWTGGMGLDWEHGLGWKQQPLIWDGDLEGGHGPGRLAGAQGHGAMMGDLIRSSVRSRGLFRNPEQGEKWKHPSSRREGGKGMREI